MPSQIRKGAGTHKNNGGNAGFRVAQPKKKNWLKRLFGALALGTLVWQGVNGYVQVNDTNDGSITNYAFKNMSYKIQNFFQDEHVPPSHILICWPKNDMPEGMEGWTNYTFLTSEVEAAIDNDRHVVIEARSVFAARPNMTKRLPVVKTFNTKAEQVCPLWTTPVAEHIPESFKNDWAKAWETIKAKIPGL